VPNNEKKGGGKIGTRWEGTVCLPGMKVKKNTKNKNTQNITESQGGHENTLSYKQIQGLQNILRRGAGGMKENGGGRYRRVDPVGDRDNKVRIKLTEKQMCEGWVGTGIGSWGQKRHLGDIVD